MDVEQLKKDSSPISLPLIAPINEQFMIMANSAPVLLWIAGTDMACFFFNKVWLQFTGRSLEQELGNGWLEGVHPEDLDRYLKTYTEAFDKREEFKIEYRLLHYDEKYRWILDTGVPYFTKDKIFSGYIGSCVDIHEIKELEQRKDQFINVASHELKTPVTSLSVYLHLLTEYFENNQEDKFSSYAHSAVEQVNKITSLINRLLDLSRIQSGSLNFEWSVFSFCDLVTIVVKKIQSTTFSHEIEINGNCKGTVKGDRERLSQAIENLLTNAIKYSKGRDKILVELSEDNKYVKVCVIDYGIGIETDHLPQIFDRFYRIRGSKEDTFPGMGIGLYLSKEIVKRHGGYIGVESIRNKETKFNFQIPVFKRN